MKAYDRVNWQFLLTVLEKFGFPQTIIQWIEACITSTMFSVVTNGELEGFFKGASSLRQGDPSSPYLFVLVMEVFSMIVRKEVNASRTFKFHWKCDKLKVAHICFADDILMFSRGNLHSVLSEESP